MITNVLPPFYGSQCIYCVVVTSRQPCSHHAVLSSTQSKNALRSFRRGVTIGYVFRFRPQQLPHFYVNYQHWRHLVRVQLR